MSIDPKKGGKCWSCEYCEDIATQDDNPNGSYYRKCLKSGREYIDTCSNYCSDYVWDGQHPENVSSSSSASTYHSQSYVSTNNHSSQETEKEGCFSRLGGCLVTLLVIGLVNAAIGGLLWLIFGGILGN